MSETVMYEGKLEKLELKGETKSDKFKELLKYENIVTYEDLEDIDLSDEKIEDIYWSEGLDETYFYIGGNYYKVLTKKDKSDEDIFNIVDNGDGTYTYLLQYYNGGCSFSEAIEEGFKNIKGK